MAAAGAIASLIGSVSGLFGGGDDAPEAPAPLAPPPPPAPEAVERGKSADETIAEQADKNRTSRRRKTDATPSINKLKTSSSDKKTLLGE